MDQRSSDQSTSSSDGEEDDWLDADQEADQDEGLAVISLLDDRVFPDAMSMLAYCKETYALDFLAIRQRLSLDFHGTVKLINFIRQRVHNGLSIPESITSEDLADDAYLKPVLDDDALILCLDDLPSAPEPDADGGSEGENRILIASLLQKNSDLQAELEQLASQFANYRLAVQQTLDKRWGDDGEDAVQAGLPAGQGESSRDGKDKDDSQYYWESYAHNDIHETMLKDTVRTDAYRDFIYNNKDLFKDKVVLDIGCGTGILSMFCAKAGAKRVIAVDKSDIVDKARENVFRNGLDNNVVCLKGRIEDVTLPVDKVDIIVSEWMGYCLLYEAMLPSVLWARDRYLQPDGLLVPSHASMWVAPVSDGEYIGDHIAFWRDVYGFDMQAMQEGIFAETRVEMLPTGSLCGGPSMFRFLDLHTVTVDDLTFDAKWATKLDSGMESLDGFTVWFDIFFARSRAPGGVGEDETAQSWAANGQDRTSFTTSPMGKETHWKQGLFLIDSPKTAAAAAAGNDLVGSITYSIPEDHARGLVVKISWGVPGTAPQQSQQWVIR